MRHHKDRAQSLLAEAEKCGEKYGADGCPSYAAEAGHLRATVRELCAELDKFHGLPRQGTCTWLTLFGAPVLVEYEYEPGEPMVWRYADGSGHPGSPDSAEVTGFLLNGNWCDPTDLPTEVVAGWVEEICNRESTMEAL